MNDPKIIRVIELASELVEALHRLPHLKGLDQATQDHGDMIVAINAVLNAIDACDY